MRFKFKIVIVIAELNARFFASLCCSIELAGHFFIMIDRSSFFCGEVCANHVFNTHSGSIVNGFEIFYPARLEKAYDAIVTRMSRSFAAGRGENTEGEP